MNYLITGANGFVGKKLSDFILNQNHKVYALDLNWNNYSSPNSNIEYITADITNATDLKNKISNFNLHGVFHLAAQASVHNSWQNPFQTYNVNLLGTVALTEALKLQSKLPKLLFISTGEVYGKIGINTEIDEQIKPNPCNPYGLSKYFCEQIINNFYELFCIARPFSIIGVGQSEHFAIPNFCKQIANMKKHKSLEELCVGNIEVIKNFLSLDDVLNAYWILMEKGTNKEIYNVASENYCSIKDILNMLKEISGVNFKIKIETERLRPQEPQAYKVNIDKIKALGFKPKQSIFDSLKQIIQSNLENQ